MSFEQIVKIPLDRVGVVVGREGKVKSDIEERCGVALMVDSKTGDILIKIAKPISGSQPFKAVEVVTAIGKGFSPERAFKLLEEECVLNVLDLREYAGKSENALTRIKGRIIGLGGKSRRTIEELTSAYISVYGHTVALIGEVDEVKQAGEAIGKLALGSPHSSIYRMLQKAKTKAKMERAKLWDEKPPG
jgi:ribosomal RNA assembly protein